MIKKRANIVFIFLIAFFIVILMSNIVIAGVPDDIAQVTTKFIEGVKDFGSPVFKAILGTSSTGNEFVVQILAFILATLIVYGILDSVNIFGGRSGLNFAVGAIVSLIGIRFLPEGILQAMAIPSSALVAAIVLIVPFIIAFYIIEVKMTQYPLARKVLWVAYGVLIIFLWFTNWDNPKLSGYNWIYFLILVGCILVFSLDGTIQKWWSKAKRDRTIDNIGNVERDRITARIADLQTALANASTNEDRIRLNRELRELNENLRNL